MPSDALLEILKNTRRPIVTLSWLTLGGIGFWLLVGIAVALGAYGRVAEGSYSVAVAILTWSMIGIPLLLHIWPIWELRRSATAITAFVSSPNNSLAVSAIRAQRLYWRAMAICHLSVILWVVCVIFALQLVIAWENNQPQSLRLLDAPR